MSGANGRRVRVEFPDKRGGSPSTLTQPSPRGRGIYWFQGSPFQSLLSPKNDPSEKVQGLGLVHRLLFNRLRFRILDGSGL